MMEDTDQLTHTNDSVESESESDVDTELPPPPPGEIQPPAPLQSVSVDEATAATPGVQETSVTVTPIVPVAVPVLRGTFSRTDAGALILKGAWTMTENDTVSSAFEFVKRADTIAPSVPTVPEGGSELSETTPSRAGDAAEHPFSGIYDGFFMLKRLNAPEAKIAENGVTFKLRALTDGENVEIAGVSTQLQPGDLYLFGSGSNEFGTFELRGRFDPETQEVTLAKGYTSVALAPLALPHKKQASRSRPGSQQKRPGGPPKPKPATTGAPRPKPASTPAALPSPLAGLSADAREHRKRSVPTHLRDVLTPGAHSGAMAQCAKILEVLISHNFSEPFLQPVDPVALNIPDYPRIIKRPMDLGTIKHKLNNGAYMSHEEFADDTRTTFNNAMTFNAPGTIIFDMADRLKKRFEGLWRQLMKGLAGDHNGSIVSESSDDEHKRRSRPIATSSKPKPPAPAKKRVRPPAESSGVKRVAAVAPQPASVVYADPGVGVTTAEVAELKSELQALRMQLKLMAQMSANAQMAAAPAIKIGELSYEEKRDLSMRINQLEPDKLARVVQIIAERMPLGAHSASDDIEIDIDALDVDTLRRLQDFVKANVPKQKRVAAPAKSKQELMKAVAQDSEANRQRLVAMEKALTSGAIAAQRPVGGYGSDLSDSDSDGDVPPPPPPPGTRF